MYEIIIIDDEERIAEGIAHLFPWEQMGFSVAAYFQSGRRALQYIESHHVDVVVSDIEMPDLSGIELCERISGMPVALFLSAVIRTTNIFGLRSATRWKIIF